MDKKEIIKLLKGKVRLETISKLEAEKEKDEFFIAYHMGACDTLTELIDFLRDERVTLI